MRLKLGSALLVLLACVAGNSRAATVVPKERSTLSGVPGDVRTVMFSPDGKWLAVSTGQIIKVWEWESNGSAGREVASIPGGIGAAFSKDGTLLAFPGQNEFYSDGLMIWDIAAKAKKLFIEDDNVQSPVFSPDGKQLSAAVGSTVKTWDLATGKELAPMKDGHKCSISAILFANAGKGMISADGKGNILRWEMAEPVPLKKAEFKREGEETPINSLALSKDGKWIAASTGDGDIMLLDATTLVSAGVIKAHNTPGLRVKSVAFSPDSTMLASACSGLEDLEIKLWNVATKKQILNFVGHQGGVNSVTFSPDGKWLASGSDDKTAKVWEVAALLALNAPKPEKKKVEKPAE